MTNCKLCGKKIETNSEFVLEGKFPSLFKRYLNFDFYGMGYYGDCYHKSCFSRKNR